MPDRTRGGRGGLTHGPADLKGNVAGPAAKLVAWHGARLGPQINNHDQRCGAAHSIGILDTVNETSHPVRNLIFVGTLIVILLSIAGVAGAYVVPHTAPPAIAGSPSQPDGGDPEDVLPGSEPSGWDDSADLDPSGRPSGSTAPRHPVGRPADALAGWAVPLAAKVGIPATALQAYGYAELVLAKKSPNCRLSWTTLAGIGKHESDHGRANGAKLSADGKALPPIVGVPLDGSEGRDAIPDTDGGTLDGDRTWDRAIGPMQFIPSTWKQHAVDADSDATTDPNDIDDAALTAGVYLCASGRDLSTAAGWYAAIMTYNAVRIYANQVYATANDYGTRSRG